MTQSRRYDTEIAQGRAIAPHAEQVWGWASAAGQIRAARRAQLLIDAAELSPGRTALELGCGVGTFTRMLAGSGARIFPMDLSVELLQRLRAADPRANSAAVAALAEWAPFPDGAFDAVVGSSILHHTDLDRTLAEIRRLLRHGGRLAFAEPNMLNPQIAFQKNIPAVKRRMGDTEEETAFFRWGMAAQLRRHGFANPQVVPHEFLHPAIPARLIPAVNRLGKVLETVPVVREIAGSLLITASKS